MKNLLLNLTFTTLLLSVGYSQCEESNWQEYYPEMQGCDLSGANLQGADLSEANLASAILHNVNLTGAILQGADLSGAILQGADLSGANLQGADLSWAHLYLADLSGAYLSGANLQGATLVDTNLTGADLAWHDLQNANLSGANLQGADLHNANLEEADLSGANLYQADLSGADFSGANLCNLSGVGYWECEESSGITDDNGDGYDDSSYSAGAASVTIDIFTCAELNDHYNNVGCVDGNAITQADVEAAYAAGVASVTPEDGITQDTVDAAVAVAEMESYILGAQSGDINGSGFLNVTDIILYVELILNGE